VPLPRVPGFSPLRSESPMNGATAGWSAAPALPEAEIHQSIAVPQQTTVTAQNVISPQVKIEGGSTSDHSVPRTDNVPQQLVVNPAHTLIDPARTYMNPATQPQRTFEMPDATAATQLPKTLKPSPPNLMTQFTNASASTSNDSTPSPTKTMMPPQHPKSERQHPPNIQTKFPSTPASERRPSQSSSFSSLTPTRTPTYTPTHTPGRVEYQFSPQPPPQMRPRALTQPERPVPREIPPHIMVPPYPYNMPDAKPKRRPKVDASVIDPSLMADVDDAAGDRRASVGSWGPDRRASASSWAAAAATAPAPDRRASVDGLGYGGQGPSPVSAVSAASAPPEVAADPAMIRNMLNNLRKASRRV
jgi:hypothetical protein